MPANMPDLYIPDNSSTHTFVCYCIIHFIDSLTDFYLVVLSVAENELLKPLTITVDLSISPFKLYRLLVHVLLLRLSYLSSGLIT